MSFTVVVFLNFVISVSTQGTLDPSAPEAFTTEDSDTLISFIDTQRRGIAEAADEQCVTYSATLATQAQTESDRCSFQATDGSYISYFEPDTSAGTTVTAAKPDIVTALFSWVGVSPFYTYSATGGVCDDGSTDPATISGQCDIYKQLIWSAASQVGCSISKCSDMDGIGAKGYNIVCKFDVAGNTPNTPPYTLGAQCSNCGTLACSDPGDGSGNICCGAGASTSAPTDTGSTETSNTVCSPLVPPKTCGTGISALYSYCGGFGSYCDTTTGQCCQGQGNVLPVLLTTFAPSPALGNITSTLCASGTVETDRFSRPRICSRYSYPSPNMCGIGFTCTSGFCCA